MLQCLTEIHMKAIWFWLTRYMVIAHWDGIRKVHWAATEREAREWMRCYPADAIAAYGKRGKLIAARWSV